MSVSTATSTDIAMGRVEGGKDVHENFKQAHVAVIEVEQVQSEVLRLQGVIRMMWQVGAGVVGIMILLAWLFGRRIETDSV